MLKDRVSKIIKYPIKTKIGKQSSCFPAVPPSIKTFNHKMSGPGPWPEKRASA